MNISIILTIVFIIAGICLIIFSVMKTKKCTETVMGKVVDIAREETYINNSDSDNPHTEINIGNNSINIGGNPANRQINLFPIYEYTVGEHTYTKKSNTSSNSAFIGQEVEIHYNPENPNQYYTGKNLTGIVIGAILIVVGIACIFIPIG